MSALRALHLIRLLLNRRRYADWPSIGSTAALGRIEAVCLLGCSVDVGVWGAAANHQVGEAVPCGSCEELGSARGCMGEC